MIKEAAEDYKRYKQDKEVNNRLLPVLNHETNEWQTRRWRDVRVGDVVIVGKDEFFPADLLFLASENEEGTCYIETMGLDGETNLKIKKAPDETKDLREHNVSEINGSYVQCEGPNARLYQFTGNLQVGAKKLPISPAAILLRGCSLRNTSRIIGCVIYAGHDTKVFMNSTTPPSKRSMIERHVDKIIFFMFFLLFAFCIVGAVYFAIWTEDNFQAHWYLGGAYSTGPQYGANGKVLAGLTNFVTAFVLYGYLIPISMYVTMEIVKVMQCVTINSDLAMYHVETDTPAQCRTSNLNEDLGMVTTVLSDKTGTLTRNMMEFFKCSIAGVAYGSGVTEIERANAARRGEALPEGEDPNLARYKERFFNFYDSRIMDGGWHAAQDVKTVEMFFRLLAVCHTVVPDGPADPKSIKYEAESPDEAALVVAAKVFGFFFFKRTSTSITVRESTPTGTKDVEYETLNIIEFNSTRKRQSVVVRDSSGRIIVFCKGADTVIYERLSRSDPSNEKYRAATQAHMEEFGGQGLRTLCLAYREVDPAFYQEWNARWIEAKTSLQDRDEKLAAVGEEIEKDLCLLGATAIEDKLQEGVPQCIAKLAEAGIRIWVLTGDKMETAINIGFACSLIREDMQQFIITAYFDEVDRLEAEGMEEEAAMLANKLVADQLQQVDAAIRTTVQPMEFAMVIDGKALSYALSDELAQTFLRVGLQCKAVVCCRVSPLQKAQVTALVRTSGAVTVAIGDGANDVGMIQKAHIGIGISGQEGMQAVMASDFAIAQFRYLTPLLLVHGHWSYRRISRMICFFFYKNLVFGITLFAFNAFTTFSGAYSYSDTYMTLFNVVFTSLTPFVIGIFDRDVDRKSCLRFPSLFLQGQRNDFFNFRTIFFWMCTAVWQCAVIFTLCMLGSVPWLADRSTGQPHSMYQMGVTMFSCIIVAVHLQVLIVEDQLTWVHHLSLWFSTGIWWLFLVIFEYFTVSISSDMFHLFFGVVAWSPHYWLLTLLVPIAALMPDFFLRALWRHLYPDEHHIIQELEAEEAEAKQHHRSASTRMMEEGGRDSSYGGGGSKDGRATATALAHDMERRTSNKGFVPPYTASSRFYTLLRFGRAKPSVGSSAGVAPGPDAASSNNSGYKSNPAAARNPVLTALDTELTNNPFRAKRGQATPNHRPGGGSDASLPPAAAMSPTGTAIATTEAIQRDNPMMTSEVARMLAGYTDALR